MQNRARSCTLVTLNVTAYVFAGIYMAQCVWAPSLSCAFCLTRPPQLSVPVFGAILLNASLTHVLLVRSFRGKSWGFPKGKINEGEPHADCAAREVKVSRVR